MLSAHQFDHSPIQNSLRPPSHPPSDRASTSSPRTPPLSRSLSTASPSPVMLISSLGNTSESEQDSQHTASSSAKQSSGAPSTPNPPTVDIPSIGSDLTHSIQSERQSNSSSPNSAQQVPGAASNSKGGCWTCRIRRKKCDEQRVGETGACQMCTRLRIDCLGWGPKRPQWMRDKQQVETYKAGIKEKLIKAGMVRGQPRHSTTGAPSNANNGSRSSAPHRSQSFSQAQNVSDSNLNMQTYGYSERGDLSSSYGHSNRSMTSPASFGGGLGAMGSIGPVGALGAMASSSSSAGAYEWEQYPSQTQPGSYGGAYGVNGNGQTSGRYRYDPYPSYASRFPFASASPNPQAPAVMGAPGHHLGSDYDYLSAQSAPYMTHDEGRRRRMQEKRSSWHSQHSGYGETDSSFHGGSPQLNRSPFFEDQSLSMQGFGNSPQPFGSNASLLSRPVNSYSVPGTDLSDSPLILSSGNETSLFAPSNTGAATSPSRPASGSTAVSISISDASAATNRSAPTVYGTVDDTLADPALVDPHITYYLESVLSMQYVFGSDVARKVLRELFASDPLGPLVNASCALAAKHNKTIRVSRLLDQPDADLRQSTAAQFFEKAQWQLGQCVTLNASHALAALHLAAYYLMQGGTGDWTPHVDYARTWLGKLDVASPNCVDVETGFSRLSEGEQLAAKMTMWYDVIAAISTRTSPHFLALYRRLFGNLVTRGSQPTTFSLDRSMGCPGDILLIYAETSALDHWKQQQLLMGTFDANGVITRGAAIESRLLVSSVAVSAAGASTSLLDQEINSQMHPSGPAGEHNALFSAATAHTGSGPTVETGMSAVGASEVSLSTPQGIAVEASSSSQLYHAVTRVFLHAASLYLSSVVNDPTSISNSVISVIDALRAIPERTIDRALAFPIVLVGCMAEAAEQRAFVHARLRLLEEVIGNMRSVRLLMERVWAVQSACGGQRHVDWYDIMKNDLGVEVLFI